MSSTSERSHNTMLEKYVRDRSPSRPIAIARTRFHSHGRLARFSIINNCWLVLRLLASNHEWRKDWRGGEWIHSRHYARFRSVVPFRFRFEFSLCRLLLGPLKRAQRMHFSLCCTRPMRPVQLQGHEEKKGEIFLLAGEREGGRDRDNLINICWRMEQNIYFFLIVTSF